MNPDTFQRKQILIASLFFSFVVVYSHPRLSNATQMLLLHTNGCRETQVHICRGSDSIGFSLRRPNFTLFSLTDHLQLLHFLLSTLEKGLHLGSNVPILNNYTQGVQSSLFLLDLSWAFSPFELLETRKVHLQWLSMWKWRTLSWFWVFNQNQGSL